MYIGKKKLGSEMLLVFLILVDVKNVFRMFLDLEEKIF